jgi:hypothetical protein
MSVTVSSISTVLIRRSVLADPITGVIRSRALVATSSRVIGLSDVPRTASTRSVSLGHLEALAELVDQGGRAGRRRERHQEVVVAREDVRDAGAAELNKERRRESRARSIE